MQLRNQWVRGIFNSLALAASLFTLMASGCASSSPTHIKQPAPTTYTRSTVGTPDELSPQAPGEAQNVRKVGNQWLCEVNGKTMVYNSATACWEAQPK